MKRDVGLAGLGRACGRYRGGRAKGAQTTRPEAGPEGQRGLRAEEKGAPKELGGARTGQGELLVGREPTAGAAISTSGRP
jgi:hypothetical protein